jgi:uncharacterized protein YbjQ (UPF0145 family)
MVTIPLNISAYPKKYKKQDVAMAVTKDITGSTTIAQAAVNIQNMQDAQAINAENMAETLRIQREETQHAQRMQTGGSNFALHQLNQQADVAKAGAALGCLGFAAETAGSPGAEVLAYGTSADTAEEGEIPDSFVVIFPLHLVRSVRGSSFPNDWGVFPDPWGPRPGRLGPRPGQQGPRPGQQGPRPE